MPYWTFVEAQILEALGVDYIDESEVLLLRMKSIILINTNLRFLLSAVADWASAAPRWKGVYDSCKGEPGTGNVVSSTAYAGDGSIRE